MTSDAEFMRQALAEGRRGLGRSRSPVGAVVVSADRVVGRGFHSQDGAPHAEVMALRAAGARARGATLYLTLEPCNHQGRTPPCTEAVLAAGIRRVVFAVRDPNPRVRGGGAARLRRAGVQVESGIEAAAGAELIAGFSSRVRRGLPLVTLKLAATLDGRSATRTGASRWISGPEARRLVHTWRNEMDVVMVGAATIIADDPRLTCRIAGGRDPLRVVVDGRLRIPLGARVLTKQAARGTLVATVNANPRKQAALRACGADVLALPGRRGVFSLRGLLRRLAARGVNTVLLEGGATLAAAALRERVVDRLAVFVAPKLIGDDGLAMIGPLGVRRIASAPALRITGVEPIGGDWLVRAEPEARRG